MIKKLKAIAENFKKELKLYRLVFKDKRTPLLPKILLGLALFYLILPFYIIPDFIPVLGQLDELIIVPLLVWAALKMIPKEIIEDCRKKINDVM
jgi:uncharacterized membrane protein YkvA (DUF1232 family)